MSTEGEFVVRRGEVSDIGEQIKTNHEKGPKGEGKRNGAARINDFAGREGDVIPRVGRKE